MFLDRIIFWQDKNDDARVLVTSFVRKLVADLRRDIDEKLTEKQQRRITVSTLHKVARSIVERNHGTKKWSFKPYFGIIGPSWKKIVWSDVLGFFPDLDLGAHTWEDFEQQLHRAQLDNLEEWKRLHEVYAKLCQFYNVAGFADLILRATSALRENSTLRENDHLIIDEYQDFNRAEKALIEELARDAKGMLVVGDDEQVLYQELKSSDPGLIRNVYRDRNYANGMLPFCGRSDYHIVKTADHFIRKERERECIEKIYLPLRSNDQKTKVQIIACAAPATAVDYIEKFVADHEAEIEERMRQLDTNEKKDAFLLILTPAREAKFYGPTKERIKSITLKYQRETRWFSEDYYRLRSYYSLATNLHNNFTFRRALYYEGTPAKRVHELIEMAMSEEKDFCDLSEEEIRKVLDKCNQTKAILDDEKPAPEKLEEISTLIPISDRSKLSNELESEPINHKNLRRLQREEEAEAELEETEAQRMGAVELMTIVGSKGLSADHVIIIGFDNVNMGPVTRNAFYVAMTRARRSLHILTALKSGGARDAHAFLDDLPASHAEFYSYKKSDRSKNKLPGQSALRKYLSNLDFVAGGKRRS
jgi:superfamily I DNA/RNA helicase